MATLDFLRLQAKLHETASNAYNLAMNLQNIAPPVASSGMSIKYLIEISLKLEKTSHEIESATPARDIQKGLDVLKITTVDDSALREKYQIGDKFRFIRDSLQQWTTEAEQNLPLMTETKKEFSLENLLEDEMIVYVHLYNTQGLNIKSWEPMLLPKVFYEYSINRPIYADKKELETLIKTKPNKTQHGYVCIAIKKNEIISEAKENVSLIRVKEGALRFQRFIGFTHQGTEYTLSEAGELIKK